MSTPVQAPFTPRQVDHINNWQRDVYGLLHPFTCPGELPECTATDRVLIANEKGLVCPCGKYSQGWVHSYMAGPE